MHAQTKYYFTMKKLLLLILLSTFLFSCDDDSWKTELEAIKTELANQKALIDALQNNATITGIEQGEGSYTIHFSDGQSISLTNGQTPIINIGKNGNWFINGKDTGKPSQGENGMDGTDGIDGEDGLTPTIEIDTNGYWIINGEDTGIKAQGIDGNNAPVIISIVDTGENLVFYFNDGSSISMLKQLQKKEFKILSIGNSYSFDALSYVPFILKKIAPEIDLTIGILYYGGCSLQQHYKLISNSENKYNYYEITPNLQAWENHGSTNANVILKQNNWNIVILQQASTYSSDYNSYQPYLNDIINLIIEITDYPVKFAWLLTPAYGSMKDNSINMFAQIASCSRSLMSETLVDVLFPCGTAIQNARTTLLKDIGDSGYLSYDGSHLQEGIACQIESYTVIQVLLNHLGLSEKTILNDVTIIDADWQEDKQIPGRNGEPVGSTYTNIKIAQKSALMAIKAPFTVTNIHGL